MNQALRPKEFEKIVSNKFNLYNSLFLNLPFPGVRNVGMLIPLLEEFCTKGLNAGREPVEILDSFFKTHTAVNSEKEKISFMFNIIQYIERQIVLFDSIEDAAFNNLKELEKDLSIKDYVQLTAGKNEYDSILEKLSAFSIRLVFTAHPTQFYSSSVLEIISRLRTFISGNDINNIDITLQQLGLTSLINSEKPTPLDEARNIIYFFRYVYYDAAGEFYSYLKRNVFNNKLDNPGLIQLGFWPGGDRDGNPFVTADTTMAVADELRMALMKCYYNDVKNLEQKLTFRKISDITASLRSYLYAAMFDPTQSVKYEEILNPLLKIRMMLIKEYNSLYLEELDNFIDKVKIFRTHFASIDIRQNHIVHKNIIEAVLKNQKIIKKDLGELKKEKLISILLRDKIQLVADTLKDKVLSDTVRVISDIGIIQAKNGEPGCNRYIISNSEDIFSVLFVYALLRWSSKDKQDMPVDIVPLFETMKGMSNAGSIMEHLFSIPGYRDHLRKRSNRQTIMLGFSDGTKDGGYLQANWSIFKTKEILSGICKKHGIEVIFFDGRGGPPARGGGKAHRFYASQSERIADNAIQLTIQGQTISSKYGTKQHFQYHCEQMITAGLVHSLFEKQNIIEEPSRKLIERLAALSFDKYTALKNHKMFIPYLAKKSTLQYLGQTNIGSRPDKRGNSKELELQDLRAIPFVGSWSQLKQNIPGYFGIGTAFSTLVNEGKLRELKTLFKEVPFFKALVLNSMMSLSKCNFELTAYMKRDTEYKEFWNILFEEYRLSKEMILLISGYKVLMEEESVTKSSIEIREKIVLPLLTIQQYALQKIESNTPLKEIYQKIVKRSLYGNINASRNSA